MTIEETAVLLAKIQLGDNRTVDELTIVYWHDTIGDLTLDAALTALKRFRREQPGTYLEPGHLVQLAGVVDDDPVPRPEAVNFTRDYVRAAVRAALEAGGNTEAEYDADPKLRAKITAQLALEALGPIGETE